MLFTRDGHNVFLGDIYRGSTAFLICGGPSLKCHDLSLLRQRGVLTCAVNNAATIHRPQLWLSADDPGSFSDAIWRDPGILKFTPLCNMEKTFHVRNEHGLLSSSSEKVGEMPGVFGFRRNEIFQADTWLYENSFNWGNHGNQVDDYGQKGSRSIMYIALRLLFYLGVRRLYLVGCDFKMEYGKQNYAFPQDRSAGSVKGNNSSYQIMKERFAHLLPHFQREGYEIFNCTPDSGLKVFPHVPFEDAVNDALSRQPQEINTWGMYDKKAQSQKTDEAVLRSQETVTSQDKIPALTLVVGLLAEDVEIWQRTWPTWLEHKSFIHDLPLVLLYDPSIDLAQPALRFLRERSRVKCVPLDLKNGETAARRLPAALVKTTPEHVATAWYLQLDPRAIATNQDRWIYPHWFEEKKNEQLPVFITCPWTYVRPANTIERLNDWADRIPGLSKYPRVNIPFDTSQKRLEYDTINSWCFLASTGWTREIATFTPDVLPCPAHSTYVHYCALRRGEHFIREQIKHFGWDHHFKSREWYLKETEHLLAKVGG